LGCRGAPPSHRQRVDELVAHEEGDHPAQRQEGPERHRRLAPLRGPLARDDRRADDHAGHERDEDGRSHRAPEIEAEHARELDVAHPHPARVEHRGDEEEPAARHGGDGRLGQEVAVERGDGDHGRDGGRPRDAIGDDPMVEIDQRDRDEGRDEQQAQDDAHGVVLGGDDGGVERAGGQLDERVARRDRGAAVVALAPQGEPRDDRDVVDRPQLRAAARAARARMAQRLAPRQAVDDDVEERSDDQAADGGEGDGQGHGGHKLAAGADARPHH
jgi:hypothetical protein